jgi:hypothetical protein
MKAFAGYKAVYRISDVENDGHRVRQYAITDYDRLFWLAATRRRKRKDSWSASASRTAKWDD